MMHTEEIFFPNQQALCVFPAKHSELAQAISEFKLDARYPVIVLIGGNIDEKEAKVTLAAVQTIARIAEKNNAIIICGGTDMGVMAEIGRIRQHHGYTFPLVGIAPEALVTWPDGPNSTNFLWWGTKRFQLEPHYTHFILVPGTEFGDESSWIVSAADIFSERHRSVTVLINGGEVSRKDIDLSLKSGRQVIALSRTGRLADEFARQPDRNKLITVVPANAAQRIVKTVEAALADTEKSVLAQSVKITQNQSRRKK